MIFFFMGDDKNLLAQELEVVVKGVQDLSNTLQTPNIENCGPLKLSMDTQDNAFRLSCSKLTSRRDSESSEMGV